LRNIILILLALSALYAQEPAHRDPAGPAGTAHAEAAVEHGEGHEAPMPNEIWWKWANFAILAALLWWMINKYAGPFFRSRTESIQQGIREASAMRADAEARAAEIETRIGNLSADVETMRQRSREEMAAEGERVRAETALQMAKIQARAEADIAAAAKHARDELKAYSAQMAIGAAAQQLRSRLDGSSQERLAEAFIDDLRQKVVH
jgi:F-type H+-transporting ATPase subunit b